jgi:hypothetical protein
VKAIMYPGILVQMITTKQPSTDMIEVAIVSMEQALQADGETLPAGSGTLPRDVLQIGGNSIGDVDIDADPARPAASTRAAAGAPGTASAPVEAEAAAPVSIDPPLPGV